jgi:hypothetical protein
VYILPGALAPLAKYRQFILVKFVPLADFPGKSTKLPTNPRTLETHDAHDPAIWIDAPTACSLANSLGAGYGVGFVITAATGVLCLDLDNCLQTDNTWSPAAMEMLAAFPGAVEVSNSGRGLHVWASATHVPPHGKRNKMRNMELYSDKRFIALGSTAAGAMQDITAVLPGFIAGFFPPNANNVEGGADWGTIDPEYSPLTDDDLLAKAFAQAAHRTAANAFGGEPGIASFTALWSRDVPALAAAFPPQSPGKEFDASSADHALARELAYWTGKDHARIARLMRLSMLARPKWNTDVHRSYFTDTITSAVAKCNRVWSKPVVAMPNMEIVAGKLLPRAITHETFVGRESMAELFKDCVYVRDLNQVLLPGGDLVDQQRFNAQYAGYTFVMDNENQRTTKKAWEAFIENSIITFPRVEGTVFEPSKPYQAVSAHSGRTWVNVYSKPYVDRRLGNVQPFLDLLHKLFPNGDDALILLSYYAAVVQYPGYKAKWALFVQGVQGNGKSTLTECLMHALGNKYIFTVKAAALENSFNSWLENNVLYVADDIYNTGNRSNMMEELKTLITDVRQAITLKGIDSVQKRICGNFIFNSNHRDALKKTEDARRICTLYCAQQSKSDRVRDGLTKTYFNSLYEWLNREGFAHVAEYLHTLPIDPRYNFAGDCQEAPDTSATTEAIIDGRSGLEHEVAEWIELQEAGFCGDYVSLSMLKYKVEMMPRYSKSASPLKLKEMLGRLGYEQLGRVPRNVMPDNARTVLYARVDSRASMITDPAQYAADYEATQADVINRRFNGTSN